MAAITGAVLGAAALGAGAYSASQQASATNSASRRARSDAMAQRELELQLFREGRGSTGYAILPRYAQTPGGAPIEPQLFQDALSVYNATGALTPQQRLAQYQADLQSFAPYQSQALAQAGGIFTGETERAELAAQEPVFGARTQLAKSRGAGALEKATEDANAALAIQAGRRGFTGTSSFEQRPILEMNRRGLQEQATELGQANLLNEQQRAQTRLAAINRQLQNVNLPFQLARQQAEFRQLPEQQLTDFQTGRMRAFQPFNIGPAAFFRPSPLPTPTPNVSTGQIVGQALGTAGNIGANYFLTQNMIDQQNAQNLALRQALIRNQIGTGGTGPTSQFEDLAIYGAF